MELSRLRALVLFFVFFLHFVSDICALDLRITGTELDVTLKSEYNRTFNFGISGAASGALELNDCYMLSGGINLGGADFKSGDSVFEFDVFLKNEYRFPLKTPLFVSLLYIFNTLPDYAATMHTLLPAFSGKWKWAGFSIGPSLRFSDYDSSDIIFEPILSFSVYCFVINTETIQAGLTWTNYSNFLAGNMWSYYLNMNSVIRIINNPAEERGIKPSLQIKNLSLINEIELHQSGGVGLASTFYGIAYRGGIQCQW
jgi:hypothetical protein